MYCYKGRTYCSTTENNCKNTKCSRHLETNDPHYKLSNNKTGLPLVLSDFSVNCEDYRRNE